LIQTFLLFLKKNISSFLNREIYFNGNFLKRIPNELYSIGQVATTNAETMKQFDVLKERIAAEELRLKLEKKKNEDDDEDDYEPPPVTTKKNKKKKSKGNKDSTGTNGESTVTDPNLPPQLLDPQTMLKLKKIELDQQKPLATNLEVLHLKNNLISHLPENFFSHFKRLREVKLLENPLKDPPLESVCVSSKFTRNTKHLNKLAAIPNNTNKTPESQTTFMPKLDNSTLLTPTSENNSTKNKNSAFMSSSLPSLQHQNNDENSQRINLPNLFFETNENLKPLQSYMMKYKKREGKK
jgi:hypothetical protein